MDYDEIDEYVEQLFRQNQPDGSQSIERHGDLRIDRIDQIIEDTYNEAIWWHNQRISYGTDHRSGLHGLSYVPWDENIDGVAAMHGAIGGLSDSSYARNGHPAQMAQAQPMPDERGLGCAEVALIITVAIVCIIFMIVAS